METLHPNVRIVWVLQALVGTVLVGGILLALDTYVLGVGPWVLAVAAVLALLGAAHALARYSVWRFVVDDDGLYLERGVITRVVTSVPFVRVQHVDTQRGPVQRLVGLASVVVYTAGSRGADVTIPGLAPERAEELRERLRELAIESEHEDAV
ncbi:hypothetical protein BRC81_05960 [Halobacteriales archaeon QS_1_68_20]|nr:MAG: hypothetical protein BRC81_05960 [Halobacteriales archaeon QS_1_68_20]